MDNRTIAADFAGQEGFVVVIAFVMLQLISVVLMWGICCFGKAVVFGAKLLLAVVWR